MTVLTFAARHVPPLTITQTSATGSAAGRVAKLLREVVLHERQRVTDWRSLTREMIEQIAMECSRPNWDGYGAAPISGEAKAQAQRFVEVLPIDLPVPLVVPDPDGDISLSWDFGLDRVFTISVGATATLSYAGILGKGVRRHGQELFRGDVAQVLVESIREISGSGHTPS
jgi:hypothetical protein